MILTGDYHTHTIFSHGRGTIRDNVEAAIAQGLREIAICDHGPGHFLYGVKKHRFIEMREEIDRLNIEYAKEDINILLGVEANIVSFDGDLDIDEEIMKLTDINLLGYHYGIIPRGFRDVLILYGLNPITKIFPIARKNMIDLATKAVVKAINRYPIDFITHPGSKAVLDIKILSREAAKVGTALEINSKHSQLDIESLKIALEEDVEFVISSDAHDPKDVGNIEKALVRAVEAGVPKKRIRNVY